MLKKTESKEKKWSGKKWKIKTEINANVKA